MNKRLFQSVFLGLASLTLLGIAVAVPAWAVARKAPGREIWDEFFIVSEVHLKKHHLVLEMPTQITLVMRLTSKTVFLNEHGHRLPLGKLHAGETVYINYSKAPGGDTALKIREGPMTVRILHQRYWNG